MSKKRAAAVKDGSLKLRGTFVVDLATLRKKGPLGSKISAALGNDSQRDARKKAKAAADKWFSEFIRLRDSDAEGFATCITNPKIRKHWRDMDCGHWISRAKEATRYDERNANAQSKQSNRFQGGHFLEHGLAIDRKFGPGTRQDLERKAGQVCKRTVNDYLFIADTYKKRVQWIKEHEPQRYFRKP
jgi:hypothetical protein